MNVRTTLALAASTLALGATSVQAQSAPAAALALATPTLTAVEAPSARLLALPTPAAQSLVVRVADEAPATRIPQRSQVRRRQRGVPQGVYTAIVVGMSALTIGLGIDAALDASAGRN